MRRDRCPFLAMLVISIALLFDVVTFDVQGNREHIAAYECEAYLLRQLSPLCPPAGCASERIPILLPTSTTWPAGTTPGICDAPEPGLGELLMIRVRAVDTAGNASGWTGGGTGAP
jgi:hypothetical protein